MLNCENTRNKRSHVDEFRQIWSRAIAVLNQGSEDGMLLRDDLKRMYADELAAIEEQWLAKTNAPMNKHAFFHAHVAQANERSLAGLSTHAARDSELIAADVLAEVEAHPVASSSSVKNYKGGDQIGFCFGRALLVHYLLLKAGVAPRDITKIFALGEFLVGGQFWHFHVAVMINGSVVVDPLYGEPASLDAWLKNVAGLDIKRPMSRARFFVTDARKFMPTSGAYEIDLLSPPELKPYFLDLGRSLE
jgi:hypothetical protein